jgi:ribosomal-protein-serine acetyltransferase
VHSTKSIAVDAEIALTPIWELDPQDLFDAVDQNRAHLRRWLPWVDGTQSSKETTAFQDLNKTLASGGRALIFGIVVAGEVGGVLGFNTIDQANHSGVVGYWLIESLQGRGIVTKSLTALLSHAFEELNLNRVVIAVATENYRSQRVPERLGFQREGISREAERLNDGYVDAIVYSLLRGEFSKDRDLAPKNG